MSSFAFRSNDLSRRLRPSRRLRLEPLEERRVLSLLGVAPDAPLTAYNSTGVIDYQEASDAFSLTATPTTFYETGGATPTGQYLWGSSVALSMQVDETGAVSDGTAGFVLSGSLDTNYDWVADYSGTLLTGNVLDFGFEDSGPTVDHFDFRIEVTGGELATAFAQFAVGNHVGMYATSENSTFADSFLADFGGGAKGNFGAVESPVQLISSLSGTVWNDLDGNGTRDGGEVGIKGVEVALVNAAGDTIATTLTGADGSYTFDSIEPGVYSVVETQPVDLLDGDEVAGSLGGTVDNTRDSNVITDIIFAGGEAATGYDFGEIEASFLEGLVFEDFNNDGEVNFGETALENVAVELTGTDDRGNAVSATTLTDGDGLYIFTDLRLGEYTVTEVQPAGYDDGLDLLGVVNGAAVGVNVLNDEFSAIQIAMPASEAINYNFAERPVAGGELTTGQTATIGFWQNKNGQKLIKSLNGGPDSTQLGDWLATTFPNMYGAEAGANDLTGATNTEVAEFYKYQLFKTKKKNKLPGPAKVDAQTMAVAFAVYTTNANLAGGDVAASFGFLVTEYGVGTVTVNVGDAGEAFNVADGSEIAVLDLLFATNGYSVDGVLYDTDGDDEIDGMEQLLRTLANEVFTSINEGGDRC